MDQPGVVADGRSARLRRELIPLYALAAAIVCAAGGWYLLKELGPLLRPLVLAVFLAYTVMPMHQALRGRISSLAATLLMAILAAALMIGLALMVYDNLLDFKAQLPRLSRVRCRNSLFFKGRGAVYKSPYPNPTLFSPVFFQ